MLHVEVELVPGIQFQFNIGRAVIATPYTKRRKIILLSQKMEEKKKLKNSTAICEKNTQQTMNIKGLLSPH